jgi:hypothetical protein
LLVTPIHIERADAVLEEAKARLIGRFAFDESLNDRLQGTTRDARERLRVDAVGEASARRRPYDWLRISGPITIGGVRHQVNIFVYPISGETASASFCFSNSLFEALFGRHTAVGETVDQDVKRAVIGLCSQMAEVSGADAFTYGWVRSDEDMIPLTTTDDLKRWLEAPEPDLVAKNPYFAVGIRSERIDRHRVERSWPARMIKLATSGFLLLDGIGPAV